MNSLSVWGEQVGNQDGVYYLYFAQKVNDDLVFINLLGVFDEGVEYGLEASRIGGDCRLRIFEGSSFSHVVVDTGTVVGLDVPYDYIGTAGHPIRTDDVSDWTSGYIKNLLISQP